MKRYLITTNFVLMTIVVLGGLINNGIVIVISFVVFISIGFIAPFFYPSRGVSETQFKPYTATDVERLTNVMDKLDALRLVRNDLVKATNGRDRAGAIEKFASGYDALEQEFRLEYDQVRVWGARITDESLRLKEQLALIQKELQSTQENLVKSERLRNDSETGLRLIKLKLDAEMKITASQRDQIQSLRTLLEKAGDDNSDLRKRLRESEGVYAQVVYEKTRLDRDLGNSKHELDAEMKITASQRDEIYYLKFDLKNERQQFSGEKTRLESQLVLVRDQMESLSEQMSLLMPKVMSNKITAPFFGYLRRLEEAVGEGKKTQWNIILDTGNINNLFYCYDPSDVAVAVGWLGDFIERVKGGEKWLQRFARRLIPFLDEF